MQYLIPVALLSWIPITLALFAALPASRAATVGIVGAWLILPPAQIPISGLPDYNKAMAATVGICLGTLILQPNRLLGFRPRWYDLVLVLWCLCPFVSCLQNGLGLYDALSTLLTATVRWALPYFTGRLYFNTLEDFRGFVVGIVVGGMIYLLPTVFEIRMSPMLRSYVYGMPGGWTGIRFGGYRPYVFLANGLEHGMWMTVVSLFAVWLWRSGTMRRIGPIPMGPVALPFLLVVTLLCRSSGALFLLVAGLAILWASTYFRTKSLVYALLLIAPTYYVLRISNLWSGENLVQFITTYFNEDRAESLGFRFSCENLLINRALQQPYWGWGGWGRNLVYGDNGRNLAPTDGLWIVHFGLYGLAGLISWTTASLLPPFLFLRRFSIREWTDPLIGPAVAGAMLLGLYQVDCLVNGFLNLPLLTAAGGLISLTPSSLRSPRRSPNFGDDIDGTGHEAADAAGDFPAPDPGDVVIVPQFQLAERYSELARSLRQKGNTREAKTALTHAFTLYGEAARHTVSEVIQRRLWDTANNLAWFLIVEADPGVADPTLAVQLATQATEALPDCAIYWNTLGAALLGIGEFQSSIAAVEQSMSLGGGGTAYDFLLLALAHARLDQWEPATYWHAQARSWMAAYEGDQQDLERLDAQVVACLGSRSGQPHPAH